MRKSADQPTRGNDSPDNAADLIGKHQKLHLPSAPLRRNESGPSNTDSFAESAAQNNVDFLQSSYGNISTLRHFSNRERIEPTIRKTSGDRFENEADHASAQAVENGNVEPGAFSSSRIAIQFSPEDGATATAPPVEAAKPAQESTAPPADVKTPIPGLIVDDATPEILPGQMKKSAFLAQLRAAVTATAEDALSGTIWSAMGCPWIAQWFGYYEGRDAVSIERAIQKYTGASGVTSAADYIPVICARVRSGIAAWRDTGGGSEGAATDLPASVEPPPEQNMPSTQPSVAFKSREGNALNTDPAAVQARLDSGSPLDGGVRSQMESAFGQDFSGVRVHTDSKSADLSEDLKARAFTIGSDIAFGSGEYKPGTLIGDALIAHELAHVVQQSGGSKSSTMQKGEETGTYEQEADNSAISAVASIWGGFKAGLANIARNAMPRLRSGLKLQSCSKKSSAPTGVPEIPATEADIGKKVSTEMEAVNNAPKTADKGVHYAHNYKRDYPGRWNEDYWLGYANPAYFDRINPMDWRLKPGVSASEGIKAWIGGLTIAECKSAVVAIQTDAVRAAIGDTKFDDLYGSKDKAIPESNRLRIRAGWKNSSIEKLVKPTGGGAGTEGHRPAQIGARYYFYNHPKYLLKHPGGAWQGENAIYIGEENGVQIWAGLGENHMTEDAMLQDMVKAYDKPRNDRDKEVLNIVFNDEASWPALFREGSGNFPDTTTKAQILNEPAFTIPYPEWAGTRKGGFVPDSGLTINVDAVKKL